MTRPIYENAIYRAQLEQVAQQMTSAESLRGKRVLITGATGLIGAALVDLLSYLDRSRNLGVVVIAAVRHLERAKVRFGGRVKYLKYDATQQFEFDDPVDVIVHAASAASPDLYVSKPVETLMANVNGLNELLKFAVGRHVGKVVYVSSSEVYGCAAPRENGFVETDSGSVEILNPRSSYPMGKRAAETLAACYVKQYGLNVSIVRPGHIYGPTATNSDIRVSSAFAYQAARGERIVMKSAGSQERSYTHCLDCASAILAVAVGGESGRAYNIANSDVRCSIRRMAEILAAVGGVELAIEAPSAEEQKAFNPMDNSCLDASALMALGWHGVISAEEGLRDTVRILKEHSNA